jgi:hypothetical protein
VGIRTLISSTELPTVEGLQLSSELKSNLREQIDNITTQLFGSEFMDSYMNELLDVRTDISLAFLLDSDEKEVVGSFARPKPLFKKEQVSEFLLLHSTLIRTLEKLSIDEYYRYFTMNCTEYAVAACWSGKILGVTTGAMRTSKENVLEAAANVCYHDSVDALADLEDTPKMEFRAILHQDGSLKMVDGQGLTSMAGVFVSTLVNNLDGFFRAVTHRSFENFEVVTQGTPAKKLRISKDKNTQSVVIVLYSY